MSDIEELESRLTAALDRIASGVAAIETGSGDETAGFETALEEERLVNAQLTERVRKLSEKLESAEAEANASAEALAEKVGQLDLELQRLRKANGQLRESNAALRAANEAGVGEPHLINKSMMAELESLRASRAAEMAEADTILAQIDRLMAGGEADA